MAPLADQPLKGLNLQQQVFDGWLGERSCASPLGEQLFPVAKQGDRGESHKRIVQRILKFISRIAIQPLGVLSGLGLASSTVETRVPALAELRDQMLELRQHKNGSA